MPVIYKGGKTYLSANGKKDSYVAGIIYPYGGRTVPAGYLMCNGASYLRSEYPELFAAIGIIFGAEDSDHFNVPDLCGRVPVGSASASVENGAFVLGNTGGESAHTLSISEMPSHLHTAHAVGITSASMVNTLSGYAALRSNNISDQYAADGANPDQKYRNTANTGGNQPHNNLQPYTVINYIISTGKSSSLPTTSGGGGGNANVVEITQADYDALGTNKQQDVIYFIKDSNTYVSGSDEPVYTLGEPIQIASSITSFNDIKTPGRYYIPKSPALLYSPTDEDILLVVEEMTNGYIIQTTDAISGHEMWKRTFTPVENEWLDWHIITGGVDSIIAKNISTEANAWNYVKFSSGLCMAWYQMEKTGIAMATKNGELYRSDDQNIALPFNIYEQKVSLTGHGTVIFAKTVTKTDSNLAISGFSATSTTSALYFYIDVIIIGRWK